MAVHPETIELAKHPLVRGQILMARILEEELGILNPDHGVDSWQLLDSLACAGLSLVPFTVVDSDENYTSTASIIEAASSLPEIAAVLADLSIEEIEE